MREETPLAPFLCCVLCLGARVTRAHVRAHLVVDLIYQYSLHPQIRNVYFVLGSGRFLLDPWSLLWCTLRRPFQPAENAPDSTRQLSLRTMWQRTQIELF